VKDNIKGIGFQHKLTFLFVILLITFMIFGYAQYSINKQLNETSHWVTHTHNVISSARLLIKLLVDMETGERGFLIVGQEEFLEPYNKGKLKFNRDLGQLKRIVSDNFSQVSLLDETQRLAEQWHIQAANVEISTRRDIKNSAATMEDIIDLVKAKTGKNIMDQLREKVNQFIDVEENLMKQRLELSNSIKSLSNKIFIVGVTITILFGLVIIFLVHWAVRPLENLTQSMENISTGTNFSQRVEIKGMVEVSRIAEVFNHMMQSMEHQVWLKSTAFDFSQVLQKAEDPAKLAKQLISMTGKQLQCGFGALYLLNPDNNRYELIGSYNLNARNHSKTSYAVGEGVVGQCALENDRIELTGVPKNHKCNKKYHK